MKLNRSVSYYLDKAGEYQTKAMQHSIKGNYNRAGYYSSLSLKYANYAKQKETKKFHKFLNNLEDLNKE